MNLHLHKSNSGGRPIIFQHGLCGNASQTIEAFPEDQRFQLHSLECRGHGASDSGDLNAFAITTFAADVATMIATETIAPCIIGGISMGAAISLHLAVHKPHLLSALVLTRPAWAIDAAPENMKPNAEVGHLLSHHPPDIAKTKFLASATAQALKKTAPDNLASLLAFFAREPHDVTAALLTKISADGPGVTASQVSNIKIPTLIIATDQDIIHPMTHARTLQGLIPHARLVEITPKGIDKARYVAEFRATLLKFFEENT